MSADASNADAAQTDTAAAKQPGLSGTYNGAVFYPVGGMVGAATLVVEGDKFTLEQGANKRTGTLRLSGKTVAFMKFDDSNTFPMSLQVTGSGQRLTLRTAPGEAQAFEFRGGGAADLRNAAKGAKPISHNGAVTTIAYSPDGTRMASGSYGEVFLWDATSGGVINNLPGASNAWVKYVAFSPVKSALAVAVEGGAVTLYNATDGVSLGSLAGAGGSLNMLAFSPDGLLLAGGGDDGKVVVWDAHAKTVRQTLESDGPVRSVAFSPDGKLLAAGGRNGSISLWDIDTFKARPKLNASSEQINALAFSPDGKLLASGGRDAKVNLWDVGKGEQTPRTLAGHGQAITSLAFSPDKRTLASVSLDKRVVLWDVAAGAAKEEWATESEILSVAFSPNRKTLATGGKDGSLILWAVK